MTKRLIYKRRSERRDSVQRLLRTTTMSVDISRIRNDISSLGILDLRRLVRGALPKPDDRHLKKNDLLDHIFKHGSPMFIESLQDLAHKRKAAKSSDLLHKSIARKRKRVVAQNMRRQALLTKDRSDARECDTLKFMELPSDEEV